MLKKIGTAAGLSLVLSFSSVSQADEAKVLVPSLNKSPFRIDCERDLPNGQPTLDFLGRYSSHMHGETNSTGQDNINLYTAADRQQRIEKRVQFMAPIFAKSALQHMEQTFADYDAAADKKGYLNERLESHGWDKIIPQMVQACQR